MQPEARAVGGVEDGALWAGQALGQAAAVPQRCSQVSAPREQNYLGKQGQPH